MINNELFIIVDIQGYNILDIDDKLCILLNIPDKKKSFKEIWNERIISSFEEFENTITIHKPFFNIEFNSSHKYTLKIKYNKINNKDTIEIVFNEVQNIKNFFHILENILISIVIADDSMNIIYINKLAAELFGYEKKELIGQNIKKLMPKEIAECHDNYVSNYKNTEDSKIIYRNKRTVMGKKNNGDLFECYLAINEHWDDSGRIFLASFEEISQTFNKNYLVFEDMAKYNATFMGNLSHEIRTPVNGIYGLLDILKGTELNKIQQYYVDVCFNSSNNLIKILDDMILYTKSKEGGLHVTKKPFNLIELIENTISILYENKGNRENIKIVHFIHQDVPDFIISDNKILRRILYHILSNGVKFTELGQVDLEVEKINKNKLKFSITDTGIGMTQDQLKDLFKPYVQNQTGIDKKYGGTGLGLPICKLLVELIDGDIFATSRYGRGSTFVFTMTYEEDIEETNKYKQMLISYKTQNINEINILLADDNEVNLIIFKQYLNKISSKLKKKINVSSFKNGKEISDYYLSLNNTNIDCIFMDIEMPIMNGYQATMRIRDKDENVPIIGVSGHDTLKPDFEHLFTKNLVKPIIKEKIESLLMSILSSKTSNNVNEYMDSKIVDGLSELGIEFVEPIINAWYKDVINRIDKLQSLIKNENYKDIKFISHFIKASSTQIGCHKLGKMFKLLEGAAQDQNIRRCTKIYKNIEKCFVETKKYVSELYDIPL